MLPTWVAPTLGISLFVTVIVLAVRCERHVQRVMLRLSRNQPGRMAGFVVLLHLTLIVGWLPIAVLASLLHEATGSYPAAGLVVVPYILITGPVTMSLAPGEYEGFRTSRKELRAMGGSQATSRAMYWTGAPFVLVELGLVIGAFFACFLNG